jgi:hypothetical protein
MHRFRSIFALFFLMVFTFNVVIYYTLFEYNENEAKAEMSQTISHMHSLLGTEMVTLPLSRLNDVSHDEIWLNGKLYDIVRTEVKSDSVVVYVLNDAKEENLVSNMATHTDSQCDPSMRIASAKHSSKHISKTASQKYIPSAIVSFRYHPDSHVVSCVINCFYFTETFPVQSPPPKHGLS